MLKYIIGLISLSSFLLLMSSQEQASPILRGQMMSSGQFILPLSTNSTSEKSPASTSETQAFLALEKPDHQKNQSEEAPVVVKQPLNLSLPDSIASVDISAVTQEEWVRAELPDFFGTQYDHSRMKMSGRLHWEESQEADIFRPSLDGIEGAEVELSFKTR